MIIGLAVSGLVLVSLAAARAALQTTWAGGTGSRLRMPSAPGRSKLAVKAPSVVGPRLAEAGLEIDVEHAWSVWLLA